MREEARQENSSTALRRNNKNSERLEFMTCWYTTFVTTSPGKVILLHFTDGETETERGCDVHRPGVESLTCLTSVRHSFYCRPVKVRLRLESGSCLPARVPGFVSSKPARVGCDRLGTLPPAFQENRISLPPGLNSNNYSCSWLHFLISSCFTGLNLYYLLKTIKNPFLDLAVP